MNKKTIKTNLLSILRKLSGNIITVIILTLIATTTVWVYGAFTEPSVGPASSVQDFAKNILGADNANNEFDSSTVVSNVDGSIIERLEAMICGETVSDIESNVYSTMKIGSQCWMAENMRTATYPGGGGITKGSAVHGDAVWGTDQSYYSCPPNVTNDGEECAVADSLGMLYQWSAAMNGSITEGAQGICPTGWHIPTDDEWHTLESYLSTPSCDPNRDNVWDCDPAGTKMANDVSDQVWTAGNLDGHADFASSGLDIPPSGYRNTPGNYNDRGTYAYLWSSTQVTTTAWARSLNYAYSTVLRYDYPKAYGFSVRCLKD